MYIWLTSNPEKYKKFTWHMYQLSSEHILTNKKETGIMWPFRFKVFLANLFYSMFHVNINTIARSR